MQVCIGLGDPVESPSAIEALACGCVFLNPQRKGEDVGFRGKPTSRRVSTAICSLTFSHSSMTCYFRFIINGHFC